MMSLLNNDTHIYLKVNITIQIMKIYVNKVPELIGKTFCLILKHRTWNSKKKIKSEERSIILRICRSKCRFNNRWNKEKSLKSLFPALLTFIHKWTFRSICETFLSIQDHWNVFSGCKLKCGNQSTGLGFLTNDHCFNIKLV